LWDMEKVSVRACTDNDHPCLQLTKIARHALQRSFRMSF
jgi:hypothetical protein